MFTFRKNRIQPIIWVVAVIVVYLIFLYPIWKSWLLTVHEKDIVLYTENPETQQLTLDSPTADTIDTLTQDKEILLDPYHHPRPVYHDEPLDTVPDTVPPSDLPNLDKQSITLPPSEYPPLDLPLYYQQPPAQPTPLCLVSTWSTSDLPLYALSMFETVNNNKDYVKMILFYDNIANLPPKEWYHNIEFVQVSSLNVRYKDQGFARFVTDRLCQIFDMKSSKSKQCRELSQAIKLVSDRSKAKYLIQLRGMYGRIFEPFINKSYCDAWAWIDIDTLLGNVKGWLDNELVWSTDIFTIAGLDWGNIYARGQMTVHNQKHHPQEANNAWKKCRHLSSPSQLIQAFIKRSNCIDEGCYSEGIMQSNVTFGIFPWQGNEWDNRMTRYYLYDNDRLWGVKNCDSKESCRKKIFKKTSFMTTEELNAERTVLSGSFITLQQADQLHKKTPNLQDKIFQKQYEIGRGKCMWWIPSEFKNCVQKAKLPEPASNHRLPWAILVFPKRKMQLVYWKTGKMEKNLARHPDARELLMFHYQGWKRNNRFQFEKFIQEDIKNRPLSIEITLLP